jgi:hypothetical protein
MVNTTSYVKHNRNVCYSNVDFTPLAASVYYVSVSVTVLIICLEGLVFVSVSERTVAYLFSLYVLPYCTGTIPDAEGETKSHPQHVSQT